MTYETERKEIMKKHTSPLPVPKTRNRSSRSNPIKGWKNLHSHRQKTTVHCTSSSKLFFNDFFCVSSHFPCKYLNFEGKESKYLSNYAAWPIYGIREEKSSHNFFLKKKKFVHCIFPTLFCFGATIKQTQKRAYFDQKNHTHAHIGTYFGRIGTILLREFFCPRREGNRHNSTATKESRAEQKKSPHGRSNYQEEEKEKSRGRTRQSNRHSGSIHAQYNSCPQQNPSERMEYRNGGKKDPPAVIFIPKSASVYDKQHPSPMMGNTAMRGRMEKSEQDSAEEEGRAYTPHNRGGGGSKSNHPANPRVMACRGY